MNVIRFPRRSPYAASTGDHDATRSSGSQISPNHPSLGGWWHEADASPSAPRDGRVSISCSDCTRQNTFACDDCVVALLLRPESLDAAEARTLDLFADAGIVPRSRHACTRRDSARHGSPGAVN